MVIGKEGGARRKKNKMAMNPLRSLRDPKNLSMCHCTAIMPEKSNQSSNVTASQVVGRQNSGVRMGTRATSMRPLEEVSELPAAYSRAIVNPVNLSSHHRDFLDRRGKIFDGFAKSPCAALSFTFVAAAYHPSTPQVFRAGSRETRENFLLGHPL
jgi:hypothetical protein